MLRAASGYTLSSKSHCEFVVIEICLDFFLVFRNFAKQFESPNSNPAYPVPIRIKVILFKAHSILASIIMSAESSCLKVHTVWNEFNIISRMSTAWNSLPDDLKLIQTFEQFKNSLKSWAGLKCVCPLFSR